METLNHLKNRLTRDLGNSTIWRNPLIITGGIFETEKNFYFEIHNIASRQLAIRKEFEYIVVEVTKPQVFVGGSGSIHIVKSDWLLLKQQINKRPAKWEDHLGLLAAVNRRAAQADKLVSPWCQASYLSHGSEGASSKRFSRPGEPSGPPGMHTILAGIDLSIMSRQAMKMFENMKEGDQALDEDDEDPDLSVRGRP